jgi:hypothetical protein
VEGDAVRPDLSVLDVRRHDFSVASAARVGRSERLSARVPLQDPDRIRVAAALTWILATRWRRFASAARREA